MTATVELARRYPTAAACFPAAAARSCSRGRRSRVAPAAAKLGIAPGRIRLEERSRNTVENAAFSKALTQPKPGERWLLVTSASHMPRSIGAFRRAGFAVEAYPSDWRTRGSEDLTRPFATMGDGFRRTDTAMREWVGLMVYWLTRKSSEFFPGPAP